MSLATQVFSMLKLRQRRPRSERKPKTRGSIPRWLGGSSSSATASESRPRTPPGVIYIPELSDDSDQSDDDYCRDEDKDEDEDEDVSSMASTRTHDSVFSSKSRPSAGLASNVEDRKRTHGKLHNLVHRAMHLDKLRGADQLRDQSPSPSSLIKAFANRWSMSSSMTASSQSSRDDDDDDDDRSDAEDAVANERAHSKVEFLFFLGCPDDLNMYELEVNQYRRRTNFASSPPSADKKATQPQTSTAESIIVGPTIVRAMPGLFIPRLCHGASSNLLVEGLVDDSDAMHIW